MPVYTFPFPELSEVLPNPLRSTKHKLLSYFPFWNLKIISNMRIKIVQSLEASSLPILYSKILRKSSKNMGIQFLIDSRRE
jgi:hypothetical protein